MIEPADIVTDVLATFRLTRLIVDDEITSDLREWVWKNHPPDSTKIGYFATCPWCVSIYVGAAVVAARVLLPKPWDLAARALSFSALTGLISSRESPV